MHRIVTKTDIIAELHDEGGWNFTEIAEFLGPPKRGKPQSASVIAAYYSNEYRKYKKTAGRHRHKNTKIVFNHLKTLGGEGLTQKQLAKNLGIHHVKVSQAVCKLLEWNMVQETKVKVKPTEDHGRYHKVLVSAL